MDFIHFSNDYVKSFLICSESTFETSRRQTDDRRSAHGIKANVT